MLPDEGLPRVSGRAPVPLDGKVALITGAASGIGRATALRFAREGARVGLLDFNPDTLDEAATEVNAAGPGAMPLLADVRDPAAMHAAVGQLVERFGRLDILFANAGIAGLWAPVGDIRPDEFDQLFSINVRGTFLSVQAALPALRVQGGSIVITASVTGNAMFSSVGASVYASTKAAQLAFGKMLAFELAHERIRVNIVCPGNVSTNILDHISYRNMEKLRYPVRHSGDVPLTDGAPATPDQIASAVFFLVSGEASYVTGEALVVDGAQSMFRG
ncbi:MAG: SDR family NAD(P)-dependent oxidoreductase [Anaerolineaceae bacterium]|nr:SDR family NAD(P)-dependent oxidoreductase [Anaerolineaceae bacterium]